MKNNENKLFNLDELKRLTNDDEQFIIEMIEVFIKTTEEGMVEMEEAIKLNDYFAIAGIAHKIAPPCRHMGAEKLLNTLKTIEDSIRNNERLTEIKTMLSTARQEVDEVIENLKIEINK